MPGMSSRVPPGPIGPRRGQNRVPEINRILSKEFDMPQEEVTYYLNRFYKEYVKEDLQPLRDFLLRLKMNYSADWGEICKQERERNEKFRKRMKWIQDQEEKFEEYVRQWKQETFSWLQSLEGYRIKDLPESDQELVKFFLTHQCLELSLFKKRIHVKVDDFSNIPVTDNVKNLRESHYGIPPRRFPEFLS